jgi:hypothetical protein
MIGAPGWMDSVLYNIEAKAEGGSAQGANDPDAAIHARRPIQPGNALGNPLDADLCPCDGEARKDRASTRSTRGGQSYLPRSPGSTTAADSAWRALAANAAALWRRVSDWAGKYEHGINNGEPGKKLELVSADRSRSHR